MAATTPALTLLRAQQEEALRWTGFVVKNCFIDEASPTQASRPRRLSAPPAPRRARYEEQELPAPLASDDLFDSEKAEVEEDSDGDVSTEAPASPCPTTRRAAFTSSAEEASDGERGAAEPGEGSAHCAAMPAKVEELHGAVMSRCGFIRIAGWSFRPNGSKRASDGSLMFFVAGLPCARRYKWLVPLRLTVAKVLEGCGYKSLMSVGELYVSDAEGRFKVKVDFAPSLFDR